jgi:hypothetical protein
VRAEKQLFGAMSRRLNQGSRHCRQVGLGTAIIIERNRPECFRRIDPQDVVFSHEQVRLPKGVQGLRTHRGAENVSPLVQSAAGRSFIDLNVVSPQPRLRI